MSNSCGSRAGAVLLDVAQVPGECPDEEGDAPDEAGEEQGGERAVAEIR